MVAALLALGFLAHGVSAASMMSPMMSTTATMPGSITPDDGCGGAVDEGANASGCYAACAGGVAGLTPMPVAFGRIAGPTFDAMRSTGGHGRQFPPDPDPPR